MKGSWSRLECTGPVAWRRAIWTPGDWLIYARTIDGRRCGAPRNAAVRRHVSVFPLELISFELEGDVLGGLRELLSSPVSQFGRPARGCRARHWTTPALMEINNRIMRMDAVRKRNAPTGPACEDIPGCGP